MISKAFAPSGRSMGLQSALSSRDDTALIRMWFGWFGCAVTVQSRLLPLISPAEIHPPRGNPAGVVRSHSPAASETAAPEAVDDLVTVLEGVVGELLEQLAADAASAATIVSTPKEPAILLMMTLLTIDASHAAAQVAQRSLVVRHLKARTATRGCLCKPLA